MEKSTLNRVPPKYDSTENKGGDFNNKELTRNITIGKVMLPLLVLVISFAMLAFTFAWFKEFNSLDAKPIEMSSRYITTIYFEDFEREQGNNNFLGQTGLGVKGTETESNAPYEARFALALRVDDNTPLPLKIVINIKSVTVKKTMEEAFALTEAQIANNFRVKLYNASTLEEDNKAKEQIADFILVILYWGEVENIPFEFSGIEYNGAKFTFAIDMYGEVV